MATRRPKTIVDKHKRNFETLKRAFAGGNVALMDCVEKATSEHVAVICAMGRDGGEITMTPFAKFFNGNPFEMLISPLEFGFHWPKKRKGEDSDE